MSVAAVNIISLPPAILSRARSNVQRERYRAWRRHVENFKTATGSRTTLIHVPEHVWRGQFRDDVDPCTALVEQLVAFDD